jgi:hypothetical protein
VDVFDERVVAAQWLACPMEDCGKTRKGWKVTEVHCDDCGSHQGIQCPACESVIDTVYHEVGPMLDAAKPPHRAAPGVYCSRHAGGSVMCCDECGVMWSTCCGETHDCEEHQTVRGRGDRLVPEHRIFQRGSVVTVALGPPEANPLADWPGWE